MNRQEHQFMQVVRKIAAFRGLEPDQAANLLKLFRSHTITRNEQILKAGDLSREMFVLIRGKLKVTTEGGENLAEISPGHSVGEMGVVTGRPRSANVTATQESVILIANAGDLKLFLESDLNASNMVMRNLLGLLCERLEGANDQIESVERDGEE